MNSSVPKGAQYNGAMIIVKAVKHEIFKPLLLVKFTVSWE